MRLAAALGALEGVELSVVLAGTRPEEVALWAEAGHAPAASSLGRLARGAGAGHRAGRRAGQAPGRPRR